MNRGRESETYGRGWGRITEARSKTLNDRDRARKTEQERERDRERVREGEREWDTDCGGERER